jgi:type IV secretion system protein TrbI
VEPTPPRSAPSSPYATPRFPPSVREPSWIESELEKREFEARFASNIALSYRESAGVEARVPQTASRTATEPAQDASKNDKPKRQEYRLFEGTIIETVLTNRLDGAFSGPVNCMVTTNLYSRDGQHLLIPQGSRVLGEVQKVDGFDQKRLAVTFHRLILPDGYSVNLDGFKGLNQIGETGLRDQINHHYLQVFGVSLAIGSIAGFSQANTRNGFDASAEDAYRQGVASSLSQSSLRILDRYLNVLPTFTIREGHRVKVYLSGDLSLPAYEKDASAEDL